MKKSRLLASIMIAVAFLLTGITSASAATMVKSEQLAVVKDAVEQQGDVKGVVQGLMEDFSASLMEQAYTPEEFQAAMAMIMGELLSAIPADAGDYASLVEQAFSGGMLGVATGVAEAVDANPNLDQATYEISAQNGLTSSAQEVSDNNPNLDVSILVAAIGATDIEEPEAYEPAETTTPTVPRTVVAPTAVRPLPAQDAAASPT